MIKDFLRKTKPLYDILSLPPDNHTTQKRNSKKLKGQKYSNKLILWSNDYKNIVLVFINELNSLKFCHIPDFSKPFVILVMHVRKSLYKEIDGIMKAISFASRTLAPAEKI